MSEPAKNQLLVLFHLDEQCYALHLPVVERVVRAVEVTPLPKAPDIVSGVINVQGQIIPVVDVRKLFRLPAREMELNDQIIIAHTSRRLVALVVNSVVGIRELPDQEILNAKQALPFAAYIRGVAKVGNDLVLIYDLDQFLSLDEEQALDATLSRGAG